MNASTNYRIFLVHLSYNKDTTGVIYVMYQLLIWTESPVVQSSVFFCSPIYYKLFRFHCSKHVMFKSQGGKTESFTTQMTRKIQNASYLMMWNCLKCYLSDLLLTHKPREISRKLVEPGADLPCMVTYREKVQRFGKKRLIQLLQLLLLFTWCPQNKK